MTLALFRPSVTEGAGGLCTFMGNQSSSSGTGRHGTQNAAPLNPFAVEGGFLLPMSGTYGNQIQDWDKAVVLRLIASRSLAPFYRGLQDEWESGSADRPALDKLLSQAGKVPSQAPMPTQPGQEAEQIPLITVDRSREPATHREAEAQMYERGTAECPICFLSFPANINFSRCCDQPICTECFVQIKRVEPTPTNLTSEPVACPFCVEPEFGVTYRPPPLSQRRESDGSALRAGASSHGSPPAISDIAELSVSPTSGRRKSLSASAASVVTVDHLHPDWQANLEAAKATAQRRANRRIVFRRVGDRLVPVGITSSRDVLAAAAAAEAQVGSPPNVEMGMRRSRRRPSNRDQDMQGYLSGLNGQDLEELMIMEAMRLSLLEQEEQDKKNKSAGTAAPSVASPSTGPLAHSSSAATASSTSSMGAPGLAAPLVPLPATSTSTRTTASGGGLSLLTQTAPATVALSQARADSSEGAGPLQRHPSMASSTVSTIELSSEAGYERLDDDE